MSITKHKYQSKLSTRSKVARLGWDLTYWLLFRTTPRWALAKWRVFLLRCFGATIGEGCIVSPTCRIWAPWNLELGSLVCLGDDVDCYCVDKITIGSKVAVSQRSFLCTASHEINTYQRALTHAPITIGDHVWICAEAFVAPGVTIDHSAVVAARAVAIRDVAAFEIVGGNPAQVIRKRAIEAE